MIYANNLLYDHQPSSPCVGTAETTLGEGEGALNPRQLGLVVYLFLGVKVGIAAGCFHGAWIESRTEGCGGVATRTSFVVPLC